MGSSPLSGQTKDYEIGICGFSAKLTALKRKSKDRYLLQNTDLLARNQDNASEWFDMSIRRVLFQ